MWIIFSLLCMVVLTFADIVGKKAVDADDLAPIKLRISAVAASFTVGIILYVLGLGESGLAPWTLIIEHPMIMLALVYALFSEFLYIFSMRYIGMSIMEAVSSFEGIAIFIGILIVNAATGKLATIKEMLQPGRIICIAVVMIFTIILSTLECMSQEEVALPKGRVKGNRSLPAGIIIALLAVMFGSLDSLIGDSILDSGAIGGIDFIMTIFFSSIFLMPIFVCVLVLKKSTGSMEKSPNYDILYGVLFVLQLLFGMLAASIDAVRSEVLYLCYPVIAILGAKLVLKERYSRRQELYIWVITLAAIAFCCLN